jgi:hypothetical protein
MKRLLSFGTIAICVTGIVGCQNSRVPGHENTRVEASSGGIVDKVIIPQGTKLRIALANEVSTRKSLPGDQFVATVIEPVVVDGRTVLEKGTMVLGRVTEIKGPRHSPAPASIHLVLTDIVQTDTLVPIFTNTFVAIPENPKKPNPDLQYPPQTRLSFTLTESLEM